MEMEKLKDLIAKTLKTDPKKITETTVFVDDLGADSLDMFRIVMAMEELYDIEIDDETADGIRTIEDALDVVRARTGRN